MAQIYHQHPHGAKHVPGAPYPGEIDPAVDIDWNEGEEEEAVGSW